MTGIGKKMAKSVRWSALEKGGQQGITFIVFAVLARFIAPADFGLVAMALIIIGFIQIFIDQGFSTAIIQREDVDDEFLSTAFWANLIVGIVLGVVLIGLKGATAWFFNEPHVAELIPWMALSLLFEALMAVPQALLKRNFDFRGLALRTLIARLIAGGVAIAGAVSGWGVWSLVTFTVLSGAISTMVLWWVSDWYPKFRFSSGCFKDLLCFGGNVTGVRVMSYVNIRILDIIIGYFFGAVALGYYTLASQLVGRIGSVMIQVLSQVTMSGFSRVQNSAEIMANHLLRVNRLTMTIAFPLFAFIGLMATDLVGLLYGEGWEQSAMLISLLAATGPARVMISSLGDAVMSSGAPYLVLRARTLATALLVAVLFAVLTLGPEALVLAYTASFYILALPLYYVTATRVIPLHLISYAGQQVPAMLATAVMMIAMITMREWLMPFVHKSLEIVAAVIVAIMMYLASLIVLDRRILADLRRVLFGAET